MLDSKAPNYLCRIQSHSPLVIGLVAVEGNWSARRKPMLKSRSGTNLHIYHNWYIGGTLQPKAVRVKCLALGHKVAVTGLEPMTNGSVGECSTKWASNPPEALKVCISSNTISYVNRSNTHTPRTIAETWPAKVLQKPSQAAEIYNRQQILKQDASVPRHTIYQMARHENQLRTRFANTPPVSFQHWPNWRFYCSPTSIV